MLRTMVVTFPARFPELAALADAEEEIDFFNNIAHIQMHRRSRALARLSRVRDEIPRTLKSLRPQPERPHVCPLREEDEQECAGRHDNCTLAEICHFWEVYKRV